MARLTVAVIGAGGLGGQFAYAAVKKGVKRLVIYDRDLVELSNLNRQSFFPQDVGKNKAMCLARNGSSVGFLGTELIAVPFFFQAAVERGLEQPCEAVVCAVDNDPTRDFVARHYLGKPVVFAAVSRDAGHGHVAVQEPGKACFGCIRPLPPKREAAPQQEPGTCPATPAVIDIVGVLGMLASYAVDTLVMPRPRNWNFKQVVLHGLLPDITATVPRKAGCPICGNASAPAVAPQANSTGGTRDVEA